MNLAELITESRGLKPEVKKAENNPLLEVQKSSWISHPYTQHFLDYLESERQKFTRVTIEHAGKGGDYNSLCRVAARVQTIETILNYARGNDTND